MGESRLPTEFGIFYPTGWIVVAFPEMESAQRVRGDLLTGGYDEEECRLVRCDQVIPSATAQLDDASWLGRLARPTRCCSGT